jgi:dTDP-4-amino-4,6-dideoxygalactose transaminase
VTTPSDTVKQTDPLAGYLERREEYDAAISRALRSGWYILGQEVAAFEREFAEFLGAEHAVGVASGTDAIELALRCLGVSKGDVVVTVSHTAVATVAAIDRCGATAAFADVEPDTYGMNPDSLRRVIQRVAQSGSPIRAVVPVHLYGHPVNIDEVLAVARERSVPVVEDCAQAHGACWCGRRVGTLGEMAAFSFYPTKNLGAFGDGGAVVTQNAALADAARSLRQYGWQQRYISQTRGVNSRLDELQAAILRVGLRSLQSDNERRVRLAALYSRGLEDLPYSLPTTRSEAAHVYHQYVIRCRERDALRDHLARHGIGTAIHYPAPVHAQPAYRDLGVPAELEETERICREIISLPMYPQLGVSEIDRVVTAIRSFSGTE